MPRDLYGVTVSRYHGETKNLNRSLFFSSGPFKNDFYLSYQNRILARVYKSGNCWYIHYCAACYRVKVASFTEALNLLEKEFAQCNQNTIIKKSLLNY